MAKARDMTRGSPARLLAGFALPLMLGHVFQQIYNMADSAIVGRLISIDAFAAVGAAGFLSWLVTSAILGLTQGFGTVFAQRFGAEDAAGLRRSVGVGAGCALGVSVALTALGMALAVLALPAMDTPAELLGDAQLYLYVLFGGTPLLMGYNFAAAVLRALGDSKSPVYAGILSSLLNIALDYAAVAYLGMGVAGVALGTVLAQGFSLLFCLWRLRGFAQVRLGREDLRMDGAVARQLFALGGPMALRDGLMAVGGLIYQRVINGFGAVTVAGVAAAWRYFALMEVVGAGLDGAVAVYVGQTHGAGRGDRVGTARPAGSRRGRGGGGRGIGRLWGDAGNGAVSAGALPALHPPRGAAGDGGRALAHGRGPVGAGAAGGGGADAARLSGALGRVPGRRRGLAGRGPVADAGAGARAAAGGDQAAERDAAEKHRSEGR